jgi:hypothetical protein
VSLPHQEIASSNQMKDVVQCNQKVWVQLQVAGAARLLVAGRCLLPQQTFSSKRPLDPAAAMPAPPRLVSQSPSTLTTLLAEPDIGHGAPTAPLQSRMRQAMSKRTQFAVPRSSLCLARPRYVAALRRVHCWIYSSKKHQMSRLGSAFPM